MAIRYGSDERHTYLIQGKLWLVIPGNILKTWDDLITTEGRESGINGQCFFCENKNLLHSKSCIKINQVALLKNYKAQPPEIHCEILEITTQEAD